MGALSSMIVGGISWQVFRWITPDLPADLIAVPFALVALGIVSLVTSSSHPPKALQDLSGNALTYDNRLGLIRPTSKQP